jgi:glutathione S-transferase
MTFTLFYSPGACSLSCHIALEESGLPYERRRFGATDGGTESPEYRAINPRGRVPALRLDDGTLLTEAAAILGFVADQVPDRELLPAHGTLARARAREWMGFLASSLHPAIRSVFRPDKYVDSDAAKEEVRARGRRWLSQYYADIEGRLTGQTYALGDAFSLVDAYLVVFYKWSQRPLAQPAIPPMPAYDAVMSRVCARPAVARILDFEANDVKR